MIKKTIAAILALCVLAAVAPMGVFAAEAAPAAGGVSLTIMHTNDAHGRTAAEPYIAQMKKDLVAAGENVLLLDAGDRLHGQTTANLSKGRSMVSLMNAVGYDAMTMGNHDFSYGLYQLDILEGKMNFPILDANVYDKDGERMFTPYKVFELDGVKVGVFGLSTPETVSKSDPRIVGGLTFEHPIRAAKEMVRFLEHEKCDVIVALAHLGDDPATLLEYRSDAIASTVPGIDVIIDGHSHTLLENGKTVGNTLIASTGEHEANIGVVKLTVSGGSVTAKTASLAPVPAEGVESGLVADASIAAAIAAEDKKVEPITSEVVGSTPVLLNGDRAAVRAGETNLANLLTDSLRYVTGADVSFMSGGNIRDSIQPGEITMGEVLSVAPYSNMAVKVELTGETILEILEHGVSLYPEEAGQHIQVSGLSFRFDPSAPAYSRVTEVTMEDGSPLDPAKAYTLATIDFLAAGGDGYTMMAEADGMRYYGGDAEALVTYLATTPAIRAEAEGRVSPTGAAAQAAA